MIVPDRTDGATGDEAYHAIPEEKRILSNKTGAGSY
jgi:hypothetical protein